MAFRKPKQQPRFADLNGILAQSRDTDSALYQTVQVLIERLTQFQGVTLEEVADINNSISKTNKVIIDITADKQATYLTATGEAFALPNSRQLIAGSGITFDDSVTNERTISSSGSGGLGTHYDAPLSDGDLVAAELIFAAGECIIVQVPV